MPRNRLTPAARKPINSRVAGPGSTRLSRPTANPSNNTPMVFFTVTSHGPLLGSHAAPPVATSTSGVPMPSPSTSSFRPPPSASPLALMYSNAPARGADTHGETSKLDTTPSTAAPHSEPP